MKKILFLLACTLLVGSARHVVRPYYTEYNGHRYIYFSGYEGGSMVHDPECCKEESSIW